MRLREGFAASVNIVSYRVTLGIGAQSVIDFARAAGIESPLKSDDPRNIALGGYEVSPIEMAGAYSTIGAGGIYEQPHLITKIVGSDGHVYPLPSTPPKRAFGAAEAYILTSLLTSVVDHGTATGAKALGRPVAGKTGTTNGAKDTWFSGFTSNIECTVWVGYDDGKPLGRGEFGGVTALPAWVAFMKEATKGQPVADFPRPEGIVDARIDPKSGLLAADDADDAISEVFLAGTEPTESAPKELPAPDDSKDSGTDQISAAEKDAGGRNDNHEESWVPAKI
jgi:penicillin-binding protein 1A